MATVLTRKTRHGLHYLCQVRLKGFPSLSQTFTRESQAVKWGEDVEHALRNGLPLPGEELPLDDKSIEDAVNDYLDLTEVQKSRSRHTILTDRDTGRRLKSRFGHLSLRTLTREDIEEYKLDRLQEVGPASIRHDLSMLSRIYETARIRWRLSNLMFPGQDVPLPAPPPNRKKIVPEIAFKNLFRECKASKNPLLYPLVSVLLNTGMRPQEAVLLRWSQVLLAEQVIDLTKTKTEPIRVPLSGECIEVLSSIPKQPDTDLVFLTEELAQKDKPVRFFRRAFEQACIRAHINQPRPHDVRKKKAEEPVKDNNRAAAVTLYTLRHSAATYMLMQGVDIRTVADILGHKNISQTMKYTHLADNHKIAAVNTPGLPWQQNK